MKPKKEKRIIGWAGYYSGEMDKTAELGTGYYLYAVYVEEEDAKKYYRGKNIRKVEIRVVK